MGDERPGLDLLAPASAGQADLRGTAGVPGCVGLLRGGDNDLHPERTGHCADHLDGIGPVPGAAGPEDSAALMLTGHNGADVGGLSGDPRPQGRQLGVTGPVVGSGDRCGHRTGRVGD